MAHSILIVESGRASAERLQDSLAGLAEVAMCSGAAAALRDLAELQPAIVLLGVTQDGSDPYGLCRSMRRARPDTRILFVAPQGEDEAARMDAYMAGADDFLEYPFPVEELQRKVELLLRVIEDAERLQTSLQEANSVAMLAITNTSEMGGVIDFIKRAMGCNDGEMLLKTLLSTLSSRFGLKASAQVRLDGQQKTLNTEGRSSPLEAEMLANHAQETRRIFQYGHRLIINYPTCILQVKDLPDDEAYVGRLRDHLAIMVEAADHRVHGIQIEALNRQQSLMIQQSLRHLRDVIGILEQNYKQQQSSTMQLFDQMRYSLDPLLTSLGLTEQQEQAILQLIDQAVQDAGALYEAGLMLDNHFDGILAELSTLVASEAPAPQASDSTDDSDILLF
ncbi:response regulator [Chitinilyticum litopenaei]|uniref:response regulator n=1 Tax=Chitinilyticum litopenaei TaxID=1121276 RepID=UPI000420074A|nr:response regulator [Chitinilyticum litopenaei]